MRPYSRYLAIITLAILISGCAAPQPATEPVADSSASSTADSHTGGHGDMVMDAETPFDAMFIDGMIEHHQGAIDMAEMALEQVDREEVRTLAEAIIAAQTAEIAQLQSWRSEWYPDLAPTEGMAMEMGEMTISEDESLPIEQRFITAMISHHEGAINMADMALEQAEHEEIRTLAEAIIADQEAEIEQMQSWLEEWYGGSATSSVTPSPYAPRS
jgi:uncharacterized protein (DUF305 family)